MHQDSLWRRGTRQLGNDLLKATLTSVETKKRMKNSKFYYQCLAHYTKETSDSSIDAITDSNLPDDELSLHRIVIVYQQVSHGQELSSISSEQVTLTFASATVNTWLCVGGKHQLLHLLVPMHSLERRRVEIIYQFSTTAPELKYNQQLFPEGNLALNLPVHNQAVVASSRQTVTKTCQHENQ